MIRETAMRIQPVVAFEPLKIDSTDFHVKGSFNESHTSSGIASACSKHLWWARVSLR